MAVVTNRDFTTYPSLSDTGKLAYLARTSDKWNLWLRDLPSGKETLLTTLLGNIYLVSARINRTGTQVAYSTLQGSKPVIYTIGTGGGTAEKLCEDCGQLRSWSVDGRVMLSQENIFEGSNFVSTHQSYRRGERAQDRPARERSFPYCARPFPGRPLGRLPGQTGVNYGRQQLFLAPMSESTSVEPERWIPVTELKYFDAAAAFSRDGKILYFGSTRDGFACLWAVRLDPVTGKPLTDPFPLKHFHGNIRQYAWFPLFAVGPHRMIINIDQVQSDLWMTKLPDGK